ncbi:MAG TPA: STAS domain-containing protein [Candidatus Nanopelagicales bacterium]|nr:STAS domain-containing protein [Candidatus Nanopelagicales bacterium]
MAGVTMSTLSPAPDLQGDPALLWHARHLDDWCSIALDGELDIFSAPRLRRMLHGVARTPGVATIVVDMSRVEFIDARCVGVIEEAWSSARERGRELRVVGLAGLPARVFDIVGLDHLVGGESPSRREG